MLKVSKFPVSNPGRTRMSKAKLSSASAAAIKSTSEILTSLAANTRANGRVRRNRRAGSTR